MKAFSNIQFVSYSRLWLIVIHFLIVIILSACSSSDSAVPFVPKNTLEGKVFVLGAQDDGFGNLVLYANGTDLEGAVLTVADLQTASVSVGEETYINRDGSLAITAVAAEDKVLSLGLVTDNSSSIDDDFQLVADVFTQMLDNMPQVYEAQVMTFSDDYEIQQVWTEDLPAIKTALTNLHSLRNKTALYDSMGAALEGDLNITGLIERCRPAHMLVVFTDGDDNMSSVYSDTIVGSIVDNDKTIVIMLATSDALPDVLNTLVGDNGAVVQVTDPTSLVAEVASWSASLNNIVKFTLSGVVTAGKAVSITIGSQTVDVDVDSSSLCTL